VINCFHQRRNVVKIQKKKVVGGGGARGGGKSQKKVRRAHSGEKGSGPGTTALFRTLWQNWEKAKPIAKAKARGGKNVESLKREFKKHGGERGGKRKKRPPRNKKQRTEVQKKKGEKGHGVVDQETPTKAKEDEKTQARKIVKAAPG